MALNNLASKVGAVAMAVRVWTAWWSSGLSGRFMRSTRLMDLLPLGESETITSLVLGSRANSMVSEVQIQGSKEHLVQMAAPVGAGGAVAASKSLLRGSGALLGKAGFRRGA